MITWRGKIRASQIVRGYRLDAIRFRCLFEVFDDVDPEVVLSQVDHVYIWPLDPFRGLGLNAIAHLVLDVGLIVEVPPDPPIPGGTIGPDPPPLREVGNQFLEDFEDSRVLLDVPLPREFGP